jgi:Fur family transcriptional regulator, ferric uptake regulator
MAVQKTSPPFGRKLKDRGYRMTEGRETVLDVLAGAKRGEHLSAEDIYMKAHQICPAVGLTSVYRTLDLLVQLSMVDKFDFGDGRARYELAEGSSGVKHHHHLVCTGCGAILEYDDFLEEELKLVKRTEEGLSKRYGFKITGHVVQFYGICKRCIGKEE